MYLETNLEIAQILSESGFGSPASEVSLRGVRRPNNSVGHPRRV